MTMIMCSRGMRIPAHPRKAVTWTDSGAGPGGCCSCRSRTTCCRSWPSAARRGAVRTRPSTSPTSRTARSSATSGYVRGLSCPVAHAGVLVCRGADSPSGAWACAGAGPGDGGQGLDRCQHGERRAHRAHQQVGAGRAGDHHPDQVREGRELSTGSKFDSDGAALEPRRLGGGKRI